MVIARSQTLRKVTLDSGPLISILLLQFAMTISDHRKRDAIIETSRLQTFFRESTSNRRAALDFARSLQSISTTSHVIGELRGLDRLSGNERLDFWRLSLGWLRDKQLDERLVTLLSMFELERMHTPLFEFGHADVGLTQLARTKGETLITEDRNLLHFARTQTTACLHLHDVLDGRY